MQISVAETRIPLLKLWECQKDVSYAEIILNYAKNHNGTVTKQDVARLLKLTPDQAYSEIKKLVAQGKLYRYCGGKYTKYRLSGDLHKSIKLRNK